MKITKPLIILFALLTVVPAAYADSDCRTVKGRITSELVSTFSNGDPCESNLGLCTEGRFRGDLKGKFTFVANTLTPFIALDSSATPGLDNVAATTGTITLNTKFCDGTIVIQDGASFSLTEDGFYASVGVIASMHATGGCMYATGILRQQGVFQGGCVDCKYIGEVCGIADDDDDDDDDD